MNDCSRIAFKARGLLSSVLLGLPLIGLAETFWVTEPIDVDTTFTAKNTYIMTRDIPVKSGVTLTVEDGAIVLIKNGLVPFSPYSPNQRAALTFKTGSRLKAHVFSVSACDAAGNPVQKAENGGLNFLGASRKAVKGFLTNDLFAPPSLFQAERIEAHYLGSEDRYIYPIRPKGKVFEVDDWDAFSLLGLGPNEWQIPVVVSDHSGQNGIDILNSVLRLKALTVEQSIEDGVNLTSSQLDITQLIRVHFEGTPAWDVELFDFETDHGFSWLKIAAGSTVRLRGFFGDQLMLVSPEMPPPPIVDDWFIYECCEAPLTQDASIIRF